MSSQPSRDNENAVTQPQSAASQPAPSSSASSSSSSASSSSSSASSSTRTSEAVDPFSRLADIPCDGSRVEYYGLGENTCGYCKKDGVRTPGRYSYDMRAYKLMPADYQDLLDRGWRRSGTYCYHPVNSRTCCPNYPIQCKPLSFKITRSQRKCIESINNFLINGSTKERANIDYRSNDSTSDTNDEGTPRNPMRKYDRCKSSSKSRDRRFVASCERKAKLYKITQEEAIERTLCKSINKSRQRHRVGSVEDHLFPTKRNLPKTNSNETVDLPRPKHQLEIHLCHVKSKFSEAMRNDEHGIIQRYQKAIHKEELEDWTLPRFCEFLVDSPLEIEKLDNFDYVNGTNVDNDTFSEIDRAKDPSEYILVKPPELPTAYGTYHCSYHLDGKLIAVGVIDMLTKSLTTVYFFYDPDYGHLNLGIYSALVEISIVRRMDRHFTGRSRGVTNEIINYHMGYYVHECKKMHYKTRFRPSFLLCSETCCYVSTELCLNKLKTRKYVRFNDNPELVSYSIYTEDPSVPTMLEVPILSLVTGRTKSINYVMWLQSTFGSYYANLFIGNFLLQYIRLVGEPLIPRLNLQIDMIHKVLVRRFESMENSAASNLSTTSSSTITNQSNEQQPKQSQPQLEGEASPSDSE